MTRVKNYLILFIIIITFAPSLASTEAQNFFKEAERYTVRIYGSTVTALETSSRGSWGGSGFVIHIDTATDIALVATNKHVIGDGISSLQVSFKDGERFRAIPVYIDPIYDFGVLKFKLSEQGVPKNIKVAELGSTREVEIGLRVGTFGNPVNYEYCATEGIISSLTNTPGGFSGAFLQTDAPINPGNSGGPLISLKDGKVIGLNTAGSKNSEGIGWSLSLDQLKPIITQVIKGELPYAGHMGWLGVTIQEINPDRAKEDFGAKFASPPRKVILLSGILQKGPAEKSGFLAGDIILSINNTVPMDEADFLSNMRAVAGQTCNVLVCRMGKEINLKVDIVDRGALRPKAYVTFAGMVIQPTTPTVYEKSYPWSSPDCVYVSDILEGSSAQTWGAGKGPVRGVMVNLQYHPVTSLEEFWNAIKDVQPGQPVELFYWSANWGDIIKVVYYYESEIPQWVDVK